VSCDKTMAVQTKVQFDSQSVISDPQARAIYDPQSVIPKVLDKAVAAGLMIAIAFTALAFGTVEAWSVALFELIVIILLLLWAAKAALEKRIEITVPAAALPLGGFLLLGLAQSIAFTGSDGRISSLSMDVEATRGAVAVIFFLFVCFLIGSNFFTSPERMRTLANFLIIFGLALAVFALVQNFTWEGKLFWVRSIPEAGAGTGGPFVNRNHFAGYMEMLIPIAVALALFRGARAEVRLLYGFAAVIMGIAEAASLSRGGMVSLAAGIIFVAAAGMRIKRPEEKARPAGKFSFSGQPALFAFLISVAIVAGIFWVGADSGLAERMANSQNDVSLSGRTGIWVGAWTMFIAHPILGVGLGAFQTVYPIYGRGETSFLVGFAHNDYLQALADGGIVAAGLAVWFIIATFRDFVRGLRLRDPLPQALTLGGGAGIFAILVHSLFDFNLQLPSNALLFLVLVSSLSGGRWSEAGAVKR
jgi:O-antigen ligase